MGIKMNYFDRAAEAYLQKSKSFPWSFLRKKEFTAVIKALQPAENLQLLDLGSGAGYYSLPLQQQFHMRVTAVDQSKQMLDKLSSHGIKTFCLSLETKNSLQFLKNEKFDRILVAGVLEFIGEPFEILKDCRELAKDDGRLVLLVPTQGIWPSIYFFFHRLNKNRIFPRTIEDYKRLAADAGWILKSEEICTPISCVLSFFVS
jgi:2-polyprenyl-3-methyl-5-hydroxy-6-metoxy-1,4-benzoquinol methylase